MRPFKCVETIAIIVSKQITSNTFKNEITHKLYTYKSLMYIHLNRCKQMSDVKLLQLRGTYDKFPVFFRIGTFIDSTHMKI